MAEQRRKTDYRLVNLIVFIVLLIGGWIWSLSGVYNDVEALEDAYDSVREIPEQVAVMQEQLNGHIKNFDEFKKEQKAMNKDIMTSQGQILLEIRMRNGTSN